MYARNIEFEKDVSIEIVLIDGMYEVGKIAYVDSSQEADDALGLLDLVSNSQLSQSDCLLHLQETYKAKGRYNAIANFLHDDKTGPMPFECIEQSGFYLAWIDESSDAYPLILVEKDVRSQIETKAKIVGIKIEFFGR